MILPRVAAGAALAIALGFQLQAQEVRRAIPVVPPPEPEIVPDTNLEPPVRRAEPVATPQPAEPLGISPPPEPTPPPATSYSNFDKIQFEVANGYYSRKVYDAAAPEYEKYLGQYPDGADRQAALFRLGECYRALGNVNSAKNSYAVLLANFTAGDFVGPAAYRLADMYFGEKDYITALPLYRKASARMNDPALANSAKFYSARCLEYTHQNAEARAVYEDLALTKEKNPFRDASQLSLAQLLNSSGRKKEALQQLSALAQATTNAEIKAQATVQSGLIMVDLGDRDKATAFLQEALQMPRLGRWKEVAQLGLMRLRYESGDYKGVVADFDKTTKDFSNEARPEAMLIVANSDRQLGDHAAARQIYEQIVHDFPQTSFAQEAQFQRLVSLYKVDDPGLTAAVDAYLAENPGSNKADEARLLKAEAFYRKKDYADAAPVYELLGATRLPANLKAEALFKLGWCYMQTQDAQRAVKTFTDFLDFYPNHKLVPAAMAQRALAYKQEEDLAGALKDFDTLITQYPDAKEREVALQQKALILGQQQDNRGMADTFRQLLKDYPKTAAAAQANYWIGWAAYEAKDYKTAAEALTAARNADKEQYFERASLRVMLAYYYLEQLEPLAKEVDAYMKAGGKAKVPVEILRWLGGQYLAGKNYVRAEQYFTMLTTRDDGTADDFLNLGRSELKQGKNANALDALHAYLGSSKEPVPRATGLLAQGEALLALGQYDNAQKSVNEALLLQPEGRLNAEGRTLSGLIAMARNDYEGAAKIFLSVAVVYDDPVVTPHALELAREAYMKAGNETEAAKVMNDLQTRYPEYQVKSATVR